MHETLMVALNQGMNKRDSIGGSQSPKIKQLEEKNQELFSTNKNLSNAIERMETRCDSLQ